MTEQYAFLLTHGVDPEERLEEAALWKACHDELGDAIRPVTDSDDAAGSILIGRQRHRDADRWGLGPEDYWNDEAFLHNCGRRFYTCDLDEARATVEQLHADGLGAFVKATRAKYYIGRMPVGTSFDDEIGPMAFSFCDAGRCLMVQELVEFRNERRFIVVNRQVVTHSPVAWHLTPIDASERYRHYATPRDRTGYADDDLLSRLIGFAATVARSLRPASVCIDIGTINGSPAIVETNPLHLGQLGLYACDVRALARAVPHLARHARP